MVEFTKIIDNETTKSLKFIYLLETNYSNEYN